MLQVLISSWFFGHQTICSDVLRNRLHHIALIDMIIMQWVNLSKFWLLLKEIVDVGILSQEVILEKCRTPFREFSTRTGTMRT
jgi:hypothetical protein